MHLRFGETESAFDYMMATREYLEQHGKPLAFYSDKHGIFRVNNGGNTTTGITHEALRNVSPLLASRSGLDTGEDTLAVVATKLQS